MPSVFPGIDPYLEAQGYSHDFHNTFLTYLRDALIDRLPDAYEARIEERFSVYESAFTPPKLVQPDLAVLGRSGVHPASASATTTALLEPVQIPVPMTVEVEEHYTWVEIKRLPDHELVTAIELLSPTNKSGDGRDDYLAKRMATFRQRVHLIELDFLLGGHRLPMRSPLPPGDFYALVTRADRHPMSDVHAWSVRQSPPPIRIPLRAPDADVPLDLSELLATTYHRGRYARSIDYAKSLDLPLGPADLAWAEGLPRSSRA